MLLVVGVGSATIGRGQSKIFTQVDDTQEEIEKVKSWMRFIFHPRF